MAEHAVSYVVAAASGKVNAVTVRVETELPKGTMIVSPDVFNRLQKLAFEDAKEVFCGVGCLSVWANIFATTTPTMGDGLM